VCGQGRERGRRGHRYIGIQEHRGEISRQGEAWKGREGQTEIRAGQSGSKREEEERVVVARGEEGGEERVGVRGKEAGEERVVVRGERREWW
jgi:hypothetical protein